MHIVVCLYSRNIAPPKHRQTKAAPETGGTAGLTLVQLHLRVLLPYHWATALRQHLRNDAWLHALYHLAGVSVRTAM